MNNCRAANELLLFRRAEFPPTPDTDELLFLIHHSFSAHLSFHPSSSSIPPIPPDLVCPRNSISKNPDLSLQVVSLSDLFVTFTSNLSQHTHSTTPPPPHNPSIQGGFWPPLPFLNILLTPVTTLKSNIPPNMKCYSLCC